MRTHPCLHLLQLFLLVAGFAVCVFLVQCTMYVAYRLLVDLLKSGLKRRVIRSE